jgi:hypothetical protein
VCWKSIVPALCELCGGGLGSCQRTRKVVSTRACRVYCSVLGDGEYALLDHE